MPQLAVSSWSLHKVLGPIYPAMDRAPGARVPEYPYGQGTVALLDLPATVAALGIQALEICHFHFPSTDPAYLGELRQRLQAAQVRPLTLLIDAGDITAADPQIRARDLDRIRDWIDVAAAVGMAQARVIAGDAEPDAEGIAVQRSIEGLSLLAQYGAARSVRVITENWHALSMDPDTLLLILDGVGKGVGLCADFGNFKGPAKYAALQTILPRATSCHAKADFVGVPGGGQHVMHLEDYRRCLDLARAAGFAGSYVLIFDSDGDEQASLAQMVEVVRPYL